jgi:TusA-related sulfurtransferase
MDVRHIDMRGRACPIPIVELARAARGLSPGESVEVTSDDRAFPADVSAWCKKTGHELESLRTEGSVFIARVKKGDE